MSMPDVQLQKKYGLFINGGGDASDGAAFTTRCPANGEPLAICAQATRECGHCGESGPRLPAWKKTTPKQRAAVLNKVADLIDENTEHLAMVETLDNGKPIRRDHGDRRSAERGSFPLFCRLHSGRTTPRFWMSPSSPSFCASRSVSSGPRSCRGTSVPDGRPGSSLCSPPAAAPSLSRRPIRRFPFLNLRAGAGCHPGGRLQRRDRLRQQVRPVYSGT